MSIDYSDPNWLAEAMAKAGLTPAQLAACSGVSKAQIERLRHDATKTRLPTAQKLAGCLAANAA